MIKERQDLIEEIEKINDDSMIEKIRIFVMGMMAQQGISESQRDQEKP